MLNPPGLSGEPKKDDNAGGEQAGGSQTNPGGSSEGGVKEYD